MATRRWLGRALPVKQVATSTVSGTWANGDTVTATINGKDIVITVGDDDTTANVATLIAEALSGSTLTDATASVTPSQSDRDAFAPELAEITVTASSAVVTFTSKSTTGEPFTIALTADTAGDGDVSAVSDATAATGPHHWDNADNWSGGSVPTDGDDVVVENTAVSILYALSQSATTLASLKVAASFTGTIGLPDTHRAQGSAAGYDEYRTRELTICNDADTSPNSVSVEIGGGAGAGSGRIRLNTGDCQTALTILGTGQPAESALPAVLWRGTHASNTVDISRGTLGIALFASETATVATLRQGYQSNQNGDTTVVCGSGVTFTDIDQSGGNLTIASATTTLDMTGGTCVVLGTGAHASIDVDAGTVDYRSNGTITTLNVAGTVTFAQDMRTKTVTNCSMYRGATLRDPNAIVTFTNGVDLHRCGVDDVTLDLGRHRTLTPSAI